MLCDIQATFILTFTGRIYGLPPFYARRRDLRVTRLLIISVWRSTIAPNIDYEVLKTRAYGMLFENV